MLQGMKEQPPVAVTCSAPEGHTAANQVALAHACAAIDLQVADEFADRWGQVAQVMWIPNGAVAPRGSRVIDIKSKLSVADALGDHSETHAGVQVGEIGWDVIMDNGGTLLTGSLSISQTLSHEVLELLGDPNINRIARSYADGYLYDLELCDWVEGESYDKLLPDGVAVTVSDFVCPAGFDAMAAHSSEFDYLKKLSRPFSMTKGGYMPRTSPKGTDATVYGEHMPAWKREYKRRAMARTHRRAMMREAALIAPIAP